MAYFFSVLGVIYLFFYVTHCRGLQAIGNGCKKLKNLTLSDCYFLSDKGLEAIATGCKELTHLEVNGCHNIGTMGLESIGKSCQYVPCLCNLSYFCMWSQYVCIDWKSCFGQTNY